MKKITCLSFALLFLLPAVARNYSPSVDISARIHNDGSATITQVWRIISDEGTEGYLTWGDIGDSDITDLKVSDESGMVYETQDGWDIDRSLRDKALKCGIRRFSGGGELCWGLGSYGDHTYTLQFNVSNIVKTMEDYDCLHWQFIASGMDIAPREALLTVSIDDHPITSDEILAWGFGFEGETVFGADGTLQLHSLEAFDDYSRMILLMRIPKAWVNSPSVREGKFQEVLDKAVEGADFGEFDDTGDSFAEILGFLFFIICALGASALIIALVIRDRRQIVGCKIKEIGWSRNVPFDGDIYASEYVYNRVTGTPARHEGLTRAMILRLIYRGYLVVGTDNRGRVELGFGKTPETTSLKTCEIELLDMLRESAGSDSLLQHNEFSKWARRNYKTVDAWCTRLSVEGPEALGRMNLPLKSSSCQPRAREVLGFKKYLADFTLSNERRSAEVALWQDYLVFAALYGIADQVARELKDINPDIYRELSYGSSDMRPIILMTNNYSHSVIHAVDTAHAASSGHGGGTSFGGGGGFSGGFSGGGTR